MSKKSLFVALALSLSSVISSVCAAPILTVQNGVLMGARNVDVNSVMFNVEFKDGSFNTLFPAGLTGASWATSAWSVNAANALSNQVFTGIYDLTPKLTNGCTLAGTGVCDVFTPFNSATVGGFDVRYFKNGTTTTDNFYNLTNWNKGLDLSTYPQTTYAVWSLASDVPEPASTALVGLGLAALIARRRRPAK